MQIVRSARGNDEGTLTVRAIIMGDDDLEHGG